MWGFPPARILVSGAGPHRFVRWPKPAVFSKAWRQATSANAIKQRQNGNSEIPWINYLTIRDHDLITSTWTHS